MVAQALISEVLSVNPSLKEEFLRLGWGSSRFPDLRQPLPSKPQNNRWEVADCLNLTWRQFELLVSEVFKRKHKRTRVELTPRAKDYGVDIVITTGMLPQKEIVQCKRYRPDVYVSCPDMQKFVGAMTKFKADKGYFVTTSTFSRYAIYFAEGLNVELIGGQDLIQVIGQIKDFPSPAEFASRYR